MSVAYSVRLLRYHVSTFVFLAERVASNVGVISKAARDWAHG